jgi:hypothetical protein
VPGQEDDHLALQGYAAEDGQVDREDEVGQAGSSLQRCSVAGSAAGLHCTAMHATTCNDATLN